MLVSLIAVCASVSAVSAQQAPAHKPSGAELIAQLRSEDAGVRSQAVESVSTDPVALRDPKVRAALIDLLDRENRENPAESIEDKIYGKNIDSGEDESDYREPLAETVAKIVDWSSPRQVCILAESVFLPDELADHAQVAVPCLLQRYKNSRPRSRGDVVAMLVRVLAKGKGDLDAATVREIQEIILSTLRNPDHDVKGDTIRALGEFGGADMIPALRASADAETSNDAGSQSIRRRTLRAISEIEKRAGGN
jgi:HEAT repeat protein